MQAYQSFTHRKMEVLMGKPQENGCLPSGNLTNSLLLKIAIEIVDLPPKKNSDFPVRYVKLPEGTN